MKTTDRVKLESSDAAAVAAALVAPLTAEQADEIDRWMHGHAWRHQVENSIEVMKAIQAIASGAHIVVAAQAAEPSAAAPQPVIRSAEQERDAFEALVTPESRANVSPATREGWFDWFHEGWQAARAVPPALETSYEERAELEWLRSVEAAARAYFCRYVVDEAEDEDACHNAEQHALAKDLQTALRNYGMRFPKPRAEETTENTA